MAKSYDICKNITIYTQDVQAIQSEGNEHLEDIMPTLYKIVTESKKMLDSAFGNVTKIYLTGAGTVINNLDFTSNSLNDCGNGLLLTNFEIEVLNKYKIDYTKFNSLKEVLFIVEDILNEDSSLEDLECISKSIAERDYYMNSNK